MLIIRVLVLRYNSIKWEWGREREEEEDDDKEEQEEEIKMTDDYESVEVTPASSEENGTDYQQM